MCQLFNVLICNDLCFVLGFTFVRWRTLVFGNGHFGVPVAPHFSAGLQDDRCDGVALLLPY